MIKVKFYDKVEDNLLKFAVIVSRYKGKWVFCKHKERDTYECPGGHREIGEDIIEAAKRELYEETGAKDYDLRPICVYSVCRSENSEDGTAESFGLLCYAEIERFDKLPNLEIEKIEFFDNLPKNWTYPLIQPILLEKVKNKIKEW